MDSRVAVKAFWGFPIDAGLHGEAQTLLQSVRSRNQVDAAFNAQVAEIVSRLTEAGLFAYYHRPTEIVPLHPRLKKTADTGIRVVMSALNLVIRQFFKKRTHAEMLDLADYLEAMLHHPARKEGPHLVFDLNEALLDKSLTLIQRVREDRARAAYIDEVIEALSWLVEEGVAYYYRAPSDLVGLDGFTRKTADLGIHNAQKGIRMLIDKLVRELGHAQLVELADHIESMIHLRE